MRAMKRILIIVLFLLLVADFLLFPDVIATATLHLTLEVPPRPVTAATVDGDYNVYTVRRTNGRIYVTSSL